LPLFGIEAWKLIDLWPSVSYIFGPPIDPSIDLWPNVSYNIGPLIDLWPSVSYNIGPLIDYLLMPYYIGPLIDMGVELQLCILLCWSIGRLWVTRCHIILVHQAILMSIDGQGSFTLLPACFVEWLKKRGRPSS
jgi:hypothetical protein